MSEKSHESHRSLGSDLERVDDHEIQPDEYEELPELTDELLERGKWMIGGKDLSPEEGKAAFRKSLKRGRSKAASIKVSTTVRLDADVLNAFKSFGRGWQTRLNNALRDWLKEHSASQ